MEYIHEFHAKFIRIAYGDYFIVYVLHINIRMKFLERSHEFHQDFIRIMISIAHSRM